MADKTPEQIIEDRFKALEKTASSQAQIIASLQKENAALTKSLQKSGSTDPKVEELPKIPDTVFEVGGKKYRFIVPVFRHKSERVTSIDALTDEEILTYLVDTGSEMIQEVL